VPCVFTTNGSAKGSDELSVVIVVYSDDDPFATILYAYNGELIEEKEELIQRGNANIEHG
jgi:hypothetical protein